MDGLLPPDEIDKILIISLPGYIWWEGGGTSDRENMPALQKEKGGSLEDTKDPSSRIYTLSEENTRKERFLANLWSRPPEQNSGAEL
ncbi:hypothetical protein Tco_1214273 [Tanacetum coccineum]